MTEQKFLRTLMYLALLFVTAFVAFRYLLPVFLPFLLGWMFASLAEAPVRRIASCWDVSRTLISALLMGLLFFVLSLTIYLLLQWLFLQAEQSASKLPALLASMQEPFRNLENTLLALSDRVPDGLGSALRTSIEDLFSSGSAVLTEAYSRLFSMASGFIGKVPGIFLFLVTMVVSSFMISARGENISALFKKYLPEKWLNGIRQFGTHAGRALGGWVRAQIRLIFVTFGIVFFGLLILRVRHFFLLSLGIAVVDALPILGTGTILIPWGIVCIFQGDTVRGVGLLLLYGIAALVRTVLEPRLVGKQIGLNPLLALLAFYAGFRLFGIPGMILFPIGALLVRQFWVYGNLS